MLDRIAQKEEESLRINNRTSMTERIIVATGDLINTGNQCACC